MDVLDFRVLGALEVYFDGQRVRVGGPRQCTVLAMLLMAPDRIVSIDALADAVWNGRLPATSRTQVAICIAGLRKTFRGAGCPDAVIVTVSPGYQLLSANHRIDAVEFSRRIARSREIVQEGRIDDAAQSYAAAAELWRGSALAGISAYAVEAEAARLEEQRLAAVEEWVALRLKLGLHRSLIGELTGLVNDQPLREQTRAHLMLAQYRSGHRVEAMETFRHGRQHFIEELGLEPGPLLQDLHNSILRDDPSLSVAPTATEAVEATIPPAQLPSDVPAFAGRQRELSVLDELLRDRAADRPLAVGFIIGSAGVGKSGLATHWAHRAATHFPDGQLYANLQGYDAHDEPMAAAAVVDQFLRALGVSVERFPSALHERVALYRSMLGGRQVMIVLDNVCRFSQIRVLLPGSGRCCVLVTGRNPLPELLEGHRARVLRLRPLSPGESVELLADSVGDGRVREDYVAAEELAELCDRLPLALRIAGAKLAIKPHWTVRRLVGRLRDRRNRLDELTHGESGVRGRFQLSYRMLAPAAATMYRRLGLVDASTVDARVGAALLDTTQAEAEDVLEHLVDAQLLEVVDSGAAHILRYRMFELHRLYAKERALQDDSVSERVAAHDRVVGSSVRCARSRSSTIQPALRGR